MNRSRFALMLTLVVACMGTSDAVAKRSKATPPPKPLKTKIGRAHV